ncbi:MAG: YdcF family protein [Sedimentisphaerales bacterium]|nr:YdcF family protein [Sedimentisphaerales bacterium]
MDEPKSEETPVYSGRKWRKWIFRGLLACFILSFLLALWGNIWVLSAAKGRIYDDLNTIPHRPCGLVLGCSQYMPDGRENLYFRYRINAAAELFHAGKVDSLLVSGDNSTKSYDEPSAMKQALVDEGVPEDKITIDYAGFSTLDSVVRAKTVFNQKDITVISQEFHNIRALFLCDRKGLDAVAYNARRVGGAAGLRIRCREALARTKTALDVTILNRQPHFPQ